MKIPRPRVDRGVERTLRRDANAVKCLGAYTLPCGVRGPLRVF